MPKLLTPYQYAMAATERGESDGLTVDGCAGAYWLGDDAYKPLKCARHFRTASEAWDARSKVRAKVAKAYYAKQAS